MIRSDIEVSDEIYSGIVYRDKEPVAVWLVEHEGRYWTIDCWQEVPTVSDMEMRQAKMKDVLRIIETSVQREQDANDVVDYDMSYINDMEYCNSKYVDDDIYADYSHNDPLYL